MVRSNLHLEVELLQMPKQAGTPCGDGFICERTTAGALIALCDGLGSGVQAHLAAQMALTRIQTLHRHGRGLRDIMRSLVQTMESYKSDGPYVATLLGFVRPDGQARLMTYETPLPVLVTPKQTLVLPARRKLLEGAEVFEMECYLTGQTQLVLFSDGVSQAGLGHGYGMGWGSDGAAAFIQEQRPQRLLPDLYRQAVTLSHGRSDDITLASLHCRRARSLTLMTGPPARREDDERVAHLLLDSDHEKIICGATTANIVARTMGCVEKLGLASSGPFSACQHPAASTIKKISPASPSLADEKIAHSRADDGASRQSPGCELDMQETPAHMATPPSYQLDGIDLVTEGTVTLNQLRNILELDRSRFDPKNPVTDLYDLLNQSDHIHILLGTGRNPANNHISFSQQGILPRDIVIDLIADQLRQRGKLVVVERV